MTFEATSPSKGPSSREPESIMDRMQAFRSLRASNPTLRIEDMSREVNTRHNGEMFAKILQRTIETLGLPAITGPYAGLAAGSGNPERGLAEALGLTEQMVLVDKIVHPENTGYIQADLFDFLKDWQGPSFGLVSLFGGEYIIKSNSKWDRFWHALENATRKNSYIFINYLDEKYPLPASSSFKELESSRSTKWFFAHRS